MISMKLLSSTSTHAVRGEKIVPPLPCPAAWNWGAWELWDMAEPGITAAVHSAYLAASFAHKHVGNRTLPWELGRERRKPPTLPLLSAAR